MKAVPLRTVIVGLAVATMLVVAHPCRAADDAAAGAVRLTGDSSDPQMSTFVLGQPVTLHFEAAGLEPGQALTLDLRFLDAHDRVLDERSLPVRADDAGAWQGQTEAPSDRLGFYRVEAALSNGVKLAGLGTRPAGFLTYAVMPDPEQRRDYGPQRSRFGMQGGFGRQWQERSLQMLGARWILDGSFEWRRNEPEQAGQYAQKLAESPQQPLSPRRWRIYPLPTLMAAPRWAVKPETFSYMTGTLTEAGEAAWQGYLRAAVPAFMAKYPDLSPRIYQITWEPQPPWGFKGRLADLVRLYELAYPIIHELDEHAVVAGPTLGLNHGSDRRTTADLFNLGLARYLDAYTAHPYFSLHPERDGMIRQMRWIQRVLAATGQRLPMYGTEQGQTTYERRDRELLHAQALLRQNLITLGEGFDFNMAFYIVDYHLANQSGYGYFYNLVEGVPWGPDKIAPRPIAPAYAAQSLLLDGSDAVRAIHWLGPTAWGYAFERDGQVTLALWDWQQPRDVSLPVGVDRVRVYDWMGNGRNVSTDDSQQVNLTLGPEVLYVQDVSPALWGIAGRDTLTLATDDLVVSPGSQMTLQMQLTAPADAPLRGTLMVHVDAALGVPRQTLAVDLAAGQRDMVTMPVQVPATAETGDYLVRVALEDMTPARQRRTLAMTGKTVRLVPPVAIQRVEPWLDADGSPAVRVTLSDAHGGGQQGRMMVRVPGLMDEALAVPFALEPGATQTLPVALPGLQPDPLRQYAVQVALARADEPARFARTHAVNWFAPTRLSQPPTMDGDLSDWAEVPRLTPGWLQVGDAEAPDLAVGVRLGYDDEALYVALDVVDDVFVQNWTVHNTGRGDSVELSFNLDPYHEQPDSGNVLADVTVRARSSRVVLALTREGVQVYRHDSFDGQVLATGPVPPEQIRAAIHQDELTTVYELAIPWAGMAGPGATPAALLGLGIQINDLDESDWHQCVRRQVIQPVEADRRRGGVIQLQVNRN